MSIIALWVILCNCKVLLSRTPPILKKKSSGNIVCCIVYGCNHRSNKNTSNCHLFRFSNDKNKKKVDRYLQVCWLEFDWKTRDIPGCKSTHMKYLYRMTQSNLKIELKVNKVKKNTYSSPNDNAYNIHNYFLSIGKRNKRQFNVFLSLQLHSYKMQQTMFPEEFFRERKSETIATQSTEYYS